MLALEPNKTITFSYYSYINWTTNGFMDSSYTPSMKNWDGFI